jgi:hypothetical protein
MPAQSKSQQKFFGVVKSMQKGDIPKKGRAGKIAKTMSKDDVDDFASTKHKGKPEKVKKEQRVKNLIKKIVREELAKMNEAIGKGMKWEDLKVGTVIDWQPGVSYKVTKLSKNKLSSKKHNVLKSASKHIFADKYDLKKQDFEDSVRRGFIKSLTNTNPRIKEEKLNEFNKAHFLNLIQQELESKKGQLAYANDKIRYRMTPKWERKEFLSLAKEYKKDIKELQIRLKKVSKMEEGKLTEATDSYVVWSPLLNKVYDGPVSEKEALRLVKKYSKQGQYHVGMQGTKYYNKTKLGKKNPIKEKKLSEDIEPTGGMAKIAAIVKNKQHGKVGGKTVDMQSANLLMKLYNAVKDKDKEKMNKMNEKKLIVVLHKLWSRVNLKLPV